MGSHNRNRINRRAFLRLMGTTAGVVAGQALLPATTRAAWIETPQQSMRIGVIVPESAMAPTFGPSLVSGLQQGLAQPTAPAWSLDVRQYGYRQHNALKAAEALLETGVNLIVGAMSFDLVRQLTPHLEAHRTPLIISDVGAIMPRRRHTSPFILRNSLGHWRAAWALGQWAAAHVGRRALIATSFYDSGYDTIYAFSSGFKQAGGTEPELIVTDHPTGGSPDLAAVVMATKPDVIFAAANGRRAAEFARMYHNLGPSNRIPLLVSPFFADEAWHADERATIPGMLSAHSWSPELTPQLSMPGAIAALGYDTGLLIASAAGSARKADLAVALTNTTVRGVRGTHRFNHEHLEFETPIYLREERNSFESPINTIIADLTALAANPLAAPTGVRSGWQNAYLVA
ncbi:MAG: ABC transporter substrate-binding protein [Oscillochloris sp.]|nr:ABC transporter substrate-binding protein [Oscillochloris sp.]